ncbi:MAG TPA: FAD-dependent oxidoreductase [Solirubrobacteraceae bacterium]|jgi:choline dehydrogenase-like flavoprotein|nr:FAD-dependent oxidoreductase [Solirubrobacteraceae bacterium]
MHAAAVRGDVAVIGAGLVGTAVAAELARAGAEVVLVDAGWSPADAPATHLRNAPPCSRDRALYYDLLRAHLRPVSVAPPRTSLLGDDVPVAAAGGGVNPAQAPARSMPGARTTAAAGGMGTLWTCVAPRFAPGERWDGIGDREWDALYERAEHALAVGTDTHAGSRRQERMLAALRAATPAPARAEPAPVAARRGPDGRVEWTGPREVLRRGLGEARLHALLGHHAAQRLVHAGGRVRAAQVADLLTGETARVEAGTFVLALGALRTPALLFASGLCRDPAGALGRWLSDHPLCHGQVVLRPDLAAGKEDDPEPFVVVPASAERPFHGLLVCDAYDSAALEGNVDLRLLVSLYWYARAEPDRENRVVFDDRHRDHVGLPQPAFDYRVPAVERERAALAVEDLRAHGNAIGRFVPSRPPRVTAPGSSMHLLGTTRIGRRDDGESVVDPFGRVWESPNLYACGTGLIATPTATNPSLTAVALALRTADALAGRAPAAAAARGKG